MATARSNKPVATDSRRSSNSASSSSSRRRVLRLGILLNRTLVEERQMDDVVDVTVGQSAKNTFSIPLENMPRQFTVFSVENGHYRLNFTKSMDGRISEGGQPLRLADLRAKSEDKGDYWSWPLPETTRGKIEMGDFTLLFQFVAQSPKVPKPMLPASVRGTFTDRIEPRLATILAASVLLHFSIALYAKYVYDRDKDTTIASRAYDLTFKPEETTVALLEVPLEVPTETGSAAGADPAAGQDKPKPDKTAGSDKPSTKPSTSPSTDDGGGRGKDDAVAMEEARNFALDFLGTDGTGGIAGGMADRDAGGDLGKVIAAVKDSGGKVAIGGGSTGGTIGSGDPKVGTGKGTGVSTGTVDSGSGKEDKEPAGRINVSTKSGGDDSTLTPEAVMSRINSLYMSALKRCYKDELKNDPSARGKVSLSFTVNEKGRVVSPKVSGFSSAVDSCVQGRMGSWTFPAPKDADGDPTDAQFKISLQFVPE